MRLIVRFVEMIGFLQVFLIEKLSIHARVVQICAPFERLVNTIAN